MIQSSEQFREARQRLRLSISQAAEMCGVNARTIRRWETGSGRADGRNPHPSACKIMEAALGPPRVAQHSD